ncbi:MAG: hypothetical protein ACKVE3_09660 [Dissulfuribacterales bacterium]
MRNLIISIMLSLFLLFPMTINAGYIDSSGNNNPANIDFNVSKNVTITYAVSAGQDGFCAISSHKLGDTLYGGGSDTTLVFKYPGGKNKGEDYRTVPGSANATGAFSAPDGNENWKPM